MIKVINSVEDFNKEVATHAGYSLIDFWATWCGPCRMMAPVLEAAEKELGDQINFCKVDVDKVSDLAGQFDIMSIPTIVLFKDGKEVKRMIGAVSQDAFMSELKAAIA